MYEKQRRLKAFLTFGTILTIASPFYYIIQSNVLKPKPIYVGNKSNGSKININNAVSHAFAGTSMENLKHFANLVTSGKVFEGRVFRKFPEEHRKHSLRNKSCRTPTKYPGNNKLNCTKWAVVTTINSPEESVRRLCIDMTGALLLLETRKNQKYESENIDNIRLTLFLKIRITHLALHWEATPSSCLARYRHL